MIFFELRVKPTHHLLLFPLLTNVCVRSDWWREVLKFVRLNRCPTKYPWVHFHAVEMASRHDRNKLNWMEMTTTEVHMCVSSNKKAIARVVFWKVLELLMHPLKQMYAHNCQSLNLCINQMKPSAKSLANSMGWYAFNVCSYHRSFIIRCCSFFELSIDHLQSIYNLRTNQSPSEWDIFRSKFCLNFFSLRNDLYTWNGQFEWLDWKYSISRNCFVIHVYFGKWNLHRSDLIARWK